MNFFLKLEFTLRSPSVMMMFGLGSTYKDSSDQVK